MSAIRKTASAMQLIFAYVSIIYYAIVKICDIRKYC